MVVPSGHYWNPDQQVKTLSLVHQTTLHIHNFIFLSCFVTCVPQQLDHQQHNAPLHVPRCTLKENQIVVSNLNITIGSFQNLLSSKQMKSAFPLTYFSCTSCLSRHCMHCHRATTRGQACLVSPGDFYCIIKCSIRRSTARLLGEHIQY